MKWTVGTKIGAGITLALIILVIIGTVSYQSTSSLLEASTSVEHTYEVIHDVEQVIGSLNTAETGQRGYIITGEERYLEPYFAAVPDNRPTVKRRPGENGGQFVPAGAS